MDCYSFYQHSFKLLIIKNKSSHKYNYVQRFISKYTDDNILIIISRNQSRQIYFYHKIFQSNMNLMKTYEMYDLQYALLRKELMINTLADAQLHLLVSQPHHDVPSYQTAKRRDEPFVKGFASFLQEHPDGAVHSSFILSFRRIHVACLHNVHWRSHHRGAKS